MRFWFSGPRILGIRPGISFGRKDFKPRKPRTAQTFEAFRGYVYVIKGGHGLSKIGISTNPLARLAALRTASPFPLSFEYIVAVDPASMQSIETAAHAMLAKHRVSGEWFDCPPEFTVAAIGAAAHKLNIAITSVPVDHLSLAQPPAPPPQPTKREEVDQGVIFFVMMLAGLIAPGAFLVFNFGADVVPIAIGTLGAIAILFGLAKVFRSI